MSASPGSASPASGAARPRVVVVGSANMDLVATAPALPRPGETVLGNDFAMIPGGKGANQAIAAARAGADCAFLGAIGSDSFGVTLRGRLAASGVDTTHLRVVYGVSGVAVIMVDAAGENSIVATPGANGAFLGLSPEELAAIEAADVLVAQLEIPLATVTQAARAARAAGTRVVLNAAPARALPAELTEAVDLLVVNEVEAQAVAGGAGVAGVAGAGVAGGVAGAAGGAEVGGVAEVAGAAGLASRLPDPGRGRAEAGALLAVAPRAVLTLGAEGAWYVDRDGTVEHILPPAVRSVDSTAAGDAFTGALAVAWAERRPLLDAVRWACAAGAACVQKLGASSALPQRAEIDGIFAATYGVDA